ncbi:hypothetical protein LCGC14_3143380, partial [marine sediment metagenome]
TLVIGYGINNRHALAVLNTII